GALVAQLLRKAPVVAQRVRNLTVALPDSMRVAFNGSSEVPGGQGSVTISTDGRRIAWVGVAGRDAAGVRLYVRDMDSYSIAAVPGSEGAFAPVLSADGARLVYFSDAELREVNLAKFETRVLARGLVEVSGASYLEDGSIIMAASGRLSLIAPTGATKRLAPSSATDTVTRGFVNFPRPVAGEPYVVGLVRGGPLVVASVADGTNRTIRSPGSDSAALIIGAAPKVAGGRLYWLVRDVVLAAQFDANAARITSEPVAVATGVRGDILGAADFDVAADGTVVFVPGGDPAIGHLAFLDRRGGVDTLPVPPADYAGFDLSPDGQSLLTKSVSAAGITEIRVIDVAKGGAGSRMNVGAGDVSQPGWLADGRSMLVSVAPQGAGSARILRLATDGRAVPELVMAGGLDRYAVAREGRVVIAQVTATRSANRYLSSGDDTKLFASVGGGTFTELPSLRGAVSPSMTPDGRWLTYEKYSDTETEIFLERFPLDGHPVRVPGVGYEAYFSPTGDKLFYRTGSGIVQVPLTFTRDGVTFGEPTKWVTFQFADFLGRAYKISNDERVLVKLLPSTSPQGEIRVISGTR
ncbi:MAG TPA: hypothetical protein VE869_15515, partial [Gemmatimonas sp.]|nr:hypothetical protein [Gemmatimonas sp.]